MILMQSIRDLREFLASKKRKREPVVWRVDGVASASYKPRNAVGFANFRSALRAATHWGRASERLDELDRALLKRHQVGLPVPNEVIQNADRSLSVFWQGVMVRCFSDGFVSLIGGAAGVPARKVTTDLLDALAFQTRIQQAS